MFPHSRYYEYIKYEKSIYENFFLRSLSKLGFYIAVRNILYSNFYTLSLFLEIIMKIKMFLKGMLHQLEFG